MAQSCPNDNPWTQRLEQTRSALTLLQSKAIDDALALALPLVLSWGDIPNVLNDYNAFVEGAGANTQDEVEEEEPSIEFKTKRKHLILHCRNALRFGIALLSLVRALTPDDEKEGTLRQRNSFYRLQLSLVMVQEMENTYPPKHTSIEYPSTSLEDAMDHLSQHIKKNPPFVPSLHMSLAQITSINSFASDVKCQSLAAQFMSNLVIHNPQTSHKILMDIRPSTSNASCLGGGVSWGDMVIQAATTANKQESSRTALGAITATLYNATLTLSHSKTLINLPPQQLSLLEECASDKVLICNLIRSILPVTTVIISERKESDEANVDVADDATEWISLLLTEWSSMGYFTTLYSTLGPSHIVTSVDHTTPTNEDDGETKSRHEGVTPEQLVLLHCLSGAVEESAKLKSKESDSFPLGSIEEDVLSESCVFLVKEWIRIEEMKAITTTQGEEWYLGEKSCLESASILILEMLSTTLGSQEGECSTSSGEEVQCDEIQTLRVHLGELHSLVSHVILKLSLIVDRLQHEFRDASSRELKLELKDQQWLTCLVRLLGNLCFQCRTNQDLVRMCLVPPMHSEMDTDSRVDEGSTPDRNGIHVLLSCTSFGYGCFTLREWAIMTTRYVLDNNQENQAIVEALEAQAPIDTPALRKVGIKVKLDKSGKVQVTQRECGN